MNQIINEFQQQDINSNYILNYIQKITNKINSNIASITILPYIEDGQGYGKKLTSISSTFFCFGDSYTDANIWPVKLGALLNKTPNEQGVGGTCTEYMGNAFFSNFVLDTNLSDKTSIIAYGVNDCNRNPALYRYYSFYMHVLIANYCMCTCPQNKFKGGRFFATKPADSQNAGADTITSYTEVANAFYQDTFLNTRYIFVCLLTVQTYQYDWELYVNDNVVGRFKIASVPSSYSLYPYYGVLVDLGEVIPSIVLKIKNLLSYTSTAYDFYFSCVCCWNDDDQLTNQKQLLVATIPRHPIMISPGTNYNDWTDEKWRILNDCIKNAALACIRHNLKLSVISYSDINSLAYDNLHPTNPQYDMFAYNIKKIATTL